jgi:3-oxoacyl-[acyl-carrier-protein] synthase II
MQLKRVVVTGMGALTPLGNNVNDYWQGLIGGVSGAGAITRFDASKFKTQFACEVKDLNVEDYLDRREARRMDPFTQYAMISAIEAVEDANLTDESINKSRVGVIYGSGIGGLSSFSKEVREFGAGDGTPRFTPFFIPKMIVDIASGYISIKYGFRGPNYSVVSACATSSHSIMDAYNLIRLGKADAIVTGGAEACVTEAAIGGFNSMKALSENNENASKASRPYDKTRDGFVMGEGSATLILEEYEHAKARGAKIYAEVVGSGATGDAYHITAPHPDGIGVIDVMQIALEEANLKPEDIHYVNTHGTSTPLGDIAEVKAIEQVFGDHAYNLNISSTKSMTGHLLGGAGAVEAIATIKAIQEGIVPPTINHEVDDEAFNPKLNFTFNKAQKREVNAAMSNTFGFGGHNATIIFKKCP